MITRNVTIILQLDVQSMDAGELGFVAAQLASLTLGYEKAGLETPDWLTDKSREVKLQLDLAMRSEREAELKKLRARRAALATPQEKREAIEEQIKELEARLS